MNLVQLAHAELGRRIAIVTEPVLRVCSAPASVYAAALLAIQRKCPLGEVVESQPVEFTLDYDPIYRGESQWRLLAAFDHPDDPQHCFVTGTGLTHKASAENRERMHLAAADGTMTDSMRMYQRGVEGGCPAAGKIGNQPEWFYKGTGYVLRGHGDTLLQPGFADDGGEEPEVAAAYVVDSQGTPFRVGFMPGNEFADHVMERENYLNLAHSKLRPCAIGPEICLDETFEAIDGLVSIIRGGAAVWTQEIKTGESHMAHSLANLEHHHFKYDMYRQPGQAHVHFFGAAAFSFGAEVSLQVGDEMRISWHRLGRPLVNTLGIEPPLESPISVSSLSN